jgi:two-component system sensor histidine kinase ChvG
MAAARMSGAIPERGRWYRSIRVQGAALAAVLIALPVLVYSVLAQADRERRTLVLNAVSETGDVVAAALAPLLSQLRPAEIDTLSRSLAPFSAPDRTIRVLLRPAAPAATSGFYLVAAAPPIPPDQAETERRQFLRLGIVAAGDGACAAQTGADAGPTFIGGGAEVLTSVRTVSGVAGCWVVVIATREQRVLGAVRPVAYWNRPETRAAIAIYGLMALLVAAIFAGVWTSLLRFRRLALDHHAVRFASSTAVPELGPLATAFDDMVARLRRSATMIRQAAEDNAHAFKGPIATIRQAIALLPPRQRPDERERLEAIATALARLDGLVQSARALDSAAAELLDLQPERVDLSALVAAVAESMAGSATLRGVHLDSAIDPGIAVLAPTEALETIIENLIDNAIGFSPPGGSVRIGLARRDGKAVLTVSDSGPGVPAELHEAIFERYYTHRPQAAADETHFGVGLWITRQNVLALGGTITPQPGSTGGLRMDVTLPAAD